MDGDINPNLELDVASGGTDGPKKEKNVLHTSSDARPADADENVYTSIHTPTDMVVAEAVERASASAEDAAAVSPSGAGAEAGADAPVGRASTAEENDPLAGEAVSAGGDGRAADAGEDEAAVAAPPPGPALAQDADDAAQQTVEPQAAVAARNDAEDAAAKSASDEADAQAAPPPVDPAGAASADQPDEAAPSAPVDDALPTEPTPEDDPVAPPADHGLTPLVDADAAPNTTLEGNAPGASVGVTASALNLNGTADGVTYSLSSDSSDGGFTINASTGEVTVADGAKLDFETASSHTVTVVATSADGSTSAETFTISLTDVDEFDVSAVADTDAAADSVAENAANGTSVGVTAFASDADGTTNGVTYSLSSDSSDGGFAIDASTGAITVAEGSKLDFEAASTHTVTVVATSADGSTSAETFTIALTDEDEFDVSAVADTDAAADQVAENAASGTSVGVTAFASDADGATNGITYSLSSDSSDGGFAIDASTGELTVADGSKLDFETSSSHAVTVVATSADGSTSSETFTIALTDEDEYDVSAVSDADMAADQVAENAASGTTVGVTAFASDADGSTNGVTYSLSSDSSNGGFTIDGATGAITVVDGSKLDFETASTHTVTVVATSADGSTSAETFTIALTDENEFDVSAVTDTDAAADQVAENAANGTTVGVTAFASDADGATNGVTYSLSSDSSSGGFEIDASTGEITVADGTKLDFETASTHTVTVVATSADGSTSAETFTIALTDEDEFDVSAVADTDAAADEVAENAANGTTVGVTAFASDADGSTNGITYSLSADSSDGGFTIDSATGAITVADGSKLDFETASTHTVTVVATSADGSTSAETFTIALTDEDEFDVSAVSDADMAADQVAENAANGTTVGVTAFASDADGTTNGVTYSLSSDSSDGGFAIDAASGAITVSEGSKLDFEAASTHTVTVVATSADGSTSAETFTIALTDEDEFDVSAVADTDAAADEVAENAANGTTVGVTAFASDADGSTNGITYSLSSDSSSGGFEIDASTGEITVADGTKLDFETASTHTVTVVATSADGSTSAETFTIALTDEDEFDVSAVADTDAAADEVAENAANGTTVGVTAFASDADGATNGVTYSLSSDSSDGGFAIDGATGAITVADGAKLDFETASSHTVTVVATSADGSTSAETFTIALTDEDEFDVSAVADTDAAADRVAENAANGTSVGVTAFASDADGSTNGITYSLSSDSSNGGFAIDGATGEITVADGTKLDFETASAHTVTVVATSADGSTSSETFTIALTDEDEFDVSAVSDADMAADQVAENAANGTTVGITAFASDADGATNGVTYSLSADSSDGGFAIDGATGEITVADGTKLDFETASTHTVTVVATSADGSTSAETFTIALTDEDEFDVSAVADTDAAADEVAENAASGTTVGVTAFASDADGTTNGVTYSLSSDSSDGGFTIDGATGEITVADASKLDFEASTHTVTVVATSADGSTSSETFTIALTDADEFDVSAVADTDAASDQVAENAANGTTVGITAFASDADGTTNGVTYSLSADSSDGGFAIDGATGEITVADGSKLDFETASTHTVTVVATSADGSTSAETFTIALTDENEFDVSAVTDTDAAADQVAENAANGTTVGVTAFASDADGTTNGVTYSLSSDSSSGGFEIDASTGEITVADGTKLDFETASTHTVTVVATSADGSTSAETFTIALTDEDEFDVSAVADTDAAADEVAENAANGTTVGVTAFASDADGATNGVTYSLSSDSSDGGFAIDGATGAITVADGAKLDFETASSHTVTVVATSADGSTSAETFTIALTDEDEFDVSAVADTDAAADRVAENAANGTSVGVTAFASDADGSTNGITYSLSSDSSNGGFAIDGATGEITVADGTKLDFETASAHTVTVVATSADGSTSSETFTIALTDEDEFDVSAVSDADMAADQVAENAANGTTVGITAFASDADGATNGVTYSLSADSSDGGFAIDGATGEITVADGTKLDFETASTHTVTVVATSADGSTSAETFTIALTDEDEFDVSAVSDADMAADQVAENAANGTTVGITAFASDADGATNGVTYSLSADSSDGGFAIDGATGEITVADGSKLDFETASTHTVTVVATSADGSTSAETFTIALTDEDEFDVSAVADTDAATDSVAENAANGTTVGVTAFASDADGTTNGVSYSLFADSSSGGFEIDASTGEITVADGTKLDFETASTHTVTVVATSADGSTSAETFTIALTDEDEFDVSAVADTDAAADEVAENAANGTTVGVTAFASDADGSTNGITYSLSADSSDGGFAIDASTGELTVADGSKLDFETSSSHAVTVVATSADGSTSSETFTIALTDEDEFDVSAVADTDAAADQVAENAANGTTVGVTAFASDADGSTNGITYSLSADNSDGGFAIDASTGELTVADGSKLDFETSSSHAVTVVATSADGSTSSETFTIALTDEDEYDVSAVSDADMAADQVAENAASGTTVGVTAFASDADGTTNGVTYSLSSDSSDGGFAIDGATGEITVADGSKLDFETASTHTVTVVATSADGSTSAETFTIALTDEDEFDVSAVSDADMAADQVAENAASGTTVGVTAFASDADGTTNGVTYSLSSDSSNGGFTIDGATGAITVVDGSKLDFETASTHTVTVVATSADGSTSAETFTIALTDENEFDVSAVTDTDAAADQVAENAANGTTVGVTALASDADGATNGVTYSLSSDSSSGGFEIDASTGEITVADGTKLDFETASTHTVTVVATSADGSTSAETFTIALTDEDEFDVSAVADTDAAADEVAENAANGTTVGVTAFASDADGSTNGITYSLSADSSDGGFTIDSATGAITVADGSKLDFETASTHTVTVVATSADGSTSAETFTIALTDEDEFDVSAVSDADMAADQVAENAANGTTVGVTAFASDADGTTNGVTYSLSSDSSDGGFAIDAASGAITVSDGSKLDFEAASAHTVTVVATSADGSTSAETFTIALTDEDEFDVSAVADTDAAADEVAENAANGTTVGVTAFASDADGSTNGITYSLSADSSDGGFAIDASTGELTVADGSKLDFETSSSHAVTVVATSADGSTSSETFTIALTDEDEFDVSAVSDADMAADQVAENAASGTTVGVTAFASDADGTTNGVTYSLSSDSSNGGFTIDGATGAITVVDGSKLDFETASTHTVTVVATSADGSTSAETFTIALTDENEFDVSAVTDTDAAADQVAENAANGTTVGVTAFASDADGATNGVTYSLFADSSSGGFTIDASTGEVTVADGAKLDFETASTHTVTVVATSADGSTSSETFTIALTDQDEFDVSAVADTDAASDQVAENAASGTTVGVTAFASDADGTTNGVTYSLSSDSSDGGFAIDGATGEITVADGSKLDFEASSSHTVTVVATSADGSTSSETFTIALTDQDEFDVSAVTDTDVSADQVTENAANGTAVGVTAFASDADGATNGVTYSLSSDSSDGGFAIDGATGEITVADGAKLDFETASTHTVTVVATSADGSTSAETFTIALTDEDEFDVSAVADSDAAADEVVENAANGTTVGVTAFASDADGTTNGVTYSLSADSSDGGFAIDGATGAITVSDGTKLDFEAASLHTVTVVATSADGSTSAETFTINLTDEDEFDVSAVSDADMAADQVAENAANGTTVGVTAFASDADGATNGVTYSLSSDSSDGGFAIDGATGEITVADGTKLDFETSSTHTVTVVAMSADGSTSAETFTIGLTDVNEAPTDLTFSAASLGGLGEQVVNSTTANAQTQPRIAALPDGGYVVVWTSSGQDGSGLGVYGQRFDEDGAPVGDEFRINTETANEQSAPSIAALDNGGFVVVWRSIGQDGDDRGVYGQEYDSGGAPVGGEFLVNTTTQDWQEDPVVTGLDGGGYVVVWEANGQDGDQEAVYAQRYDADGDPIGAEFRVNTTTAGDQDDVHVASLSGGGFVVVWESSDQDGSDRGVYLQRYDADGQPVAGEIRANSTTLGKQEDPVVAGLKDGGFVVVWESTGQDGSIEGVYAQRFGSDGEPFGGEFRVNTTTAGDQDDIAITALEDGGFLVSWESLNQDGSGEGAYAQRYDAEGAPVGGEFRVNTTTAGSQDQPAVAQLANGSIVFVWESPMPGGSGTEIVSDRFSLGVREDVADGALVATVEAADPDQGETFTFRLADDNGGRFAIDPGTGEITVANAKLIDFENAVSHTLTVVVTDSEGAEYSETVNLTVADDGAVDAGVDDIKTGDDGANTLDGGSEGDDELLGLAGDDELRGGTGDDVLHGGAGADELRGEEGEDVLFGGDGDDYLVGGGASASAPNLLVNGSFEADDVSGVASRSALTGWTISNGPVYAVDNDFDGANYDASDGRQFVGMDGSNNGAATIYQDVQTEAGASYALSFDAAALNHGSIKIYWNGDIVGEITPESEDWQAFQFDVVGTGGTDRLEFRESWDHSSNGGSVVTGIDNVSLVAQPDSGGYAVDTLDGGAGNDTLVGGLGDDVMIGGDGADLFFAGEGYGDDAISGGAGASWIDTIQLDAVDGDLGAYGTDWTVTVSSGSIESTGADFIELSQDADGVIDLADGTQISFQDVERIQF